MSVEESYRKYLDSRGDLESLSAEEVSEIHQRIGEVQDGNPELQVLFYLDEVLSRQYARGHRCGVCGMTTAQAKAANYNCTYEC